MPVEGSLLLDTHVWLWLFNGTPGKLSPACVQAIGEAAQEGSLYLSAISTWEVAVKEAKGDLILSMDCTTWIETALNAPGLLLAPLTPEILIASTRLPGELHRDPADRMLIATARRLRATLVTADERILGYASFGYLRVLDARPAGSA
jgi:PIN domain nuclease of toxin-antitoxin system